MNRKEIEEQFAAMTESAKAIIDEGKPATAFAYGIANAAAEIGGKNPLHAPYCLQEGERRILEILEYGARKGAL